MTTYAPIPMVPGPVSLHPAVLAAMSCDYPSGQIDDLFLPLYAATGERIKKLMSSTSHDVVLMTGEGMLALWAALKSCLVLGDTVLAVGTGVFGDGIGAMAASFGCKAELVSLPYNTTIGCADSLQRIEDAIRRVQPKMITAVHCETPSGTLNPLQALGEMKHRLGVPLFYVDAVASLGGVPVLAEDWHIDLVLSGSQKCLSAPPSMSIVGVSETAWGSMAKANYQGYDSILPFKTVQADGRCPYTPYWHGVAALHAATGALLDEGLDAVFTRHQAVATQCRAGLEALGIALFPLAGAVAAPTVTAALVPQEFSFPQWQKALAAKGLAIAGSFGPMAGKVFRLGHMGTQADATLMSKALQAIADTLGKNVS